MFPLKIKTNLQSLEIVEFDGIRYLMSGKGIFKEQSAIDLTDLHRHVFDYSLLTMYSLRFIPHPSKILVIGLGGGIIAREMNHYCQDADIDVIEIDKDVESIAKAHFFFKDDKNGVDKIHTYIADGFTAVHNLKPNYDIVVLDAFMGMYIPFPMMSIEFTKAAYHRLKDGGLLSINTCNSHPSFPNHLNTLRQHFENNIYELRGCRNFHTTTVYACRGDIIPSHNLDLPSKYYSSSECPSRVEFTDEIKNSKIFKLKNV